MRTVIESLEVELAQTGHEEKDVFAVALSLEEAIANAIEHGHQGDASRPVWVASCIDAQGVDIQVEDEGDGFDLSQVPDPTLPENLDRPSGRGLLLMRHYMNRVCHNEHGNCVCFCKLRSPQEALFLSAGPAIPDVCSG
jgi:serine/threonine-protein kinase RsbW